MGARMRREGGALLTPLTLPTDVTDCVVGSCAGGLEAGFASSGGLLTPRRGLKPRRVARQYC